MSALEMACPQCGARLKVPDRSLLGRKVRCNKCRHGFTLQLPAAELPTVHFAEASDDLLQESAPPDFLTAPTVPAAAGDSAEDTLVGVAPRYVPAPAPVLPTEVLELNAAVTPPPEPALAAAFLSPEIEDDDDRQALVRKRRELARRRQRLWIAGGSAGVVILAISVAFSLSGGKKPGAARGTSKVVHKPAATSDEDTGEVRTKATGKQEPAGESLTLNYVPDGARILIHLRPADLWQSQESVEEFRACLGPLGLWLETEIKARCFLEPTQIEEVLFALIPVTRESFDVAVVVRSTTDLKRSDLITKFDGELVDKPKSHYVGKERAWIIGGNRLFAGAPRAMAQSLAESVDTASPTSDGVQALLSLTDRSRHFTVLCDLEDVRLGVNTLAPENARKFLDGIVDFFGDDVDALCWSFQLGDAAGANPFQSQLLVRNRLTRTPAKLEGDLKKKLAALPAQVLGLVQLTHPRKLGEKKVVGRFPIMTKLVEQSTRFETGHRLVTLKVELPERAGPNLALGTLLTWHETTLPGFGTAPAAPQVAARADLPEKVADRLKKKITVEFRRDFLYKAVEFISEETGVTLKLDGPGMKDVGITQNEYQTFSMDSVPATEVLRRILVENTKDKVFPDGKLVLIVDEQAKTATITGVNFAKNKNQTPFPLEPAK